MDEYADSERPTMWIVIAGVLALVAIGFAIWGFSEKSDLDDSQKTVESQKQELASQGKAASSTESKDVAVGKKALSSYQQTRTKLVGEDKTAAEVEADVKKQAAELKAARAQVATAKSDTDKADAQLKQAQEETDVASACAKGTVAAINEFFDSPDPNRGVEKTIKKLQQLEPQCKDVLNS